MGTKLPTGMAGGLFGQIKLAYDTVPLTGITDQKWCFSYGGNRKVAESTQMTFSWNRNQAKYDVTCFDWNRSWKIASVLRQAWNMSTVINFMIYWELVAPHHDHLSDLTRIFDSQLLPSVKPGWNSAAHFSQLSHLSSVLCAAYAQSNWTQNESAAKSVLPNFTQVSLKAMFSVAINEWMNEWLNEWIVLCVVFEASVRLCCRDLRTQVSAIMRFIGLVTYLLTGTISATLSQVIYHLLLFDGLFLVVTKYAQHNNNNNNNNVCF